MPPTRLLPGLLFLLPVLAIAQPTVRLGVRAGANYASTTTSPAGSAERPYSAFSTEKSALAAWQAGVVAEVRFGRLAVQPALVFSQKGEQLRYWEWYRSVQTTPNNEIILTSRYNWLELPLHLVYTPKRDHGWQLLAGPYVALAVGGEQRGTSTTGVGTIYPVSVSIDEPIRYGRYHRRFDAGVQAGVGYCLGPAQVQLSYGLGLLKLRQPYQDANAPYHIHDFQADDAYNRVLQLTATFFFK